MCVDMCLYVCAHALCVWVGGSAEVCMDMCLYVCVLTLCVCVCV